MFDLCILHVLAKDGPSCFGNISLDAPVVLNTVSLPVFDLVTSHSTQTDHLFMTFTHRLHQRHFFRFWWLSVPLLLSTVLRTELFQCLGWSPGFTSCEDIQILPTLSRVPLPGPDDWVYADSEWQVCGSCLVRGVQLPPVLHPLPHFSPMSIHRGEAFVTVWQLSLPPSLPSFTSSSSTSSPFQIITSHQKLPFPETQHF